MAVRTCGSCGASVGVLADRCPSCGADPDLQVIEIGVGWSRPPGAIGEGAIRGRGWRSWWPIVAVLGVVAVLLVVAGTGGDEADAGGAAPAETTETTRRTPVTRPATTATAAVASVVPTSQGPLLGELTGLTLLTIGESTHVVDLDTGEQWEVPQQVLGGYGGRLLVATRRGIEWWPRPYDGQGAERIDDGGDTGQAWVDPATGTVWAVEYTQQPQLVSIVPGAEPRDISFDAPAWPVGLVGDRMVLNGPGGTYVVGTDGGTTRISDGDPFAASGAFVFVTACEEDLDCRVEVLDPEGAVVATPDIGANASNGMVAGSSRGALAWMAYDEGSGLEIDGRPVDVGIGGYNAIQALGWSPDGRWLFTTGASIAVVDVDTGTIIEPDLPRRMAGYQVIAFASA